MELDKTANKGQQKKAEATGRHVREDNRTDRDEIPTFFLPNQGIPKDTEDTFWVESYPILKIVSHNHNDERDFTQQVQNQTFNGHNKERGNADQNSHKVESLKNTGNMESQGLESMDNNNDDPEGWTLVTRKKKKLVSQAFIHRRNQQSYMHIHASKLRQQQKCFKCLMKGHIQAVCANQRRCLHCNMTGHILRNCPSMPRGKPTVAQSKNNFYKKGSNSFHQTKFSSL